MTSSSVSPLTSALQNPPDTRREVPMLSFSERPNNTFLAVRDQASRPELRAMIEQINALNESGIDSRLQTFVLVHLLTNTHLRNPQILCQDISHLRSLDWIGDDQLEQIYLLLGTITPTEYRIRELIALLNNNPTANLRLEQLVQLHTSLRVIIGTEHTIRDMEAFLNENTAAIPLLTRLFSNLPLETQERIARTANPENHLLKRKTYIQLIVCAMATGAIFTKALGALATKQPLNMTTKLAIGASVPLTALLGMSCYNPTRTAKYFERFVDATGNKIRSGATTTANFVKRNKKPIAYTIVGIGACALAAAAVYGTVCGVKKIASFAKEYLQSGKVETPTLDASATPGSVEAITASNPSTITAPLTLPEPPAPETEGFTLPSLSEAQTMIEEKAHAFDAYLLNIPRRIRNAYVASTQNAMADEA